MRASSRRVSRGGRNAAGLCAEVHFRSTARVADRRVEGRCCERIYVETASGLKTERPELRQLLDHARPGDVIVVYSLSRLARSIRHLLNVADDLRARDIGLNSLTEGFDTTTVSGRFMFNVLGALGQMEVELLRERTHAGLRAARARGRVGGRPKALDPVKLTVVTTLLGQGTLTVAEIAEHV
jgi:DNA invertase Pin-like site-specific DNA recombinase